MDDEIVRMFQDDTRESLADIETDLMDIEEAGVDFDPELVNKVFRAAHTIKGSASFLSFNSIRDLAHKIENVLDMVRNMEIEPTPEIISVILTAFDTLGTMVEDVEHSETMDVSDQINVLTSLVGSHLPPERKQTLTTTRGITLPDGRPVFEVTEHSLHQARKGGNYLYLVEYDLIHDVHYKDKTPFELLGFLEKSGLILDCRLDVAAVGDLTGPATNRIPFYVLYASILEPDMVKAVLQVGDEFIHAISLEEERAAAVGGEEPPTPEAAAPTEAPEPAQAQAEVAFSEDSALETVEGFSLLVDGDQGKLVLGGSLTIEQGQAMKAALLAVLDRFSHVVLEFKDVEGLDLACYQLLIAAYQTGKAKGVALSCEGDSLDVLKGVSLRAGFTPETAAMYELDGFLPLA